MKTTFLEFEQPVAELEAKIEQLRYVQDDSAVDISEEIARLQKKSASLTKDLYGKLSAWQISQVARHPQRPYSLDYINELFTDFEELLRLSAASPGSEVSRSWSLVTRKVATPKRSYTATSGCPSRKVIARRYG
jgi:hypothetical protein